MKFTINNPCTEDWDKMKIGLVSRYCEVCTKDVMDFTKLSRQEIVEYLLENQGKKTCGRILPSQLDFTRKDIIVTLHKIKNRYPNHQIPLAITLLAGMMLTGCNMNKNEEIKQEQHKTTVGKIEKKEETNNSNKKEEKANNKISHSISKNHSSSTNILKSEIDNQSIENDTLIDKKTEISQENFILGEVVDEWPEYHKGSENLNEYIQKNYSKKSKKYANQKIIVEFIVEANGKISNIKIVKSVAENYDKEAIKTIQKMPDWLPYKYNGKKISSRVKLEITIPTYFEKANAKILSVKEIE
jgi:TonB family protein